MLKKLTAILSALTLCVCLLGSNTAFAYDGEATSEQPKIKPYYLYGFFECLE